MAINVLFAGILVADLDAAPEWYERSWKLTEESWIYVVTDPARAGKGLVTVMIDDLDERLAALNGNQIGVGQAG